MADRGQVFPWHQLSKYCEAYFSQHEALHATERHPQEGKPTVVLDEPLL